MGKIVSVTSKLRRDRARRLRHHQTEAEARLWEALRAGRLDGWKWRRQAPVGPFIVDFLCLDAALAVELDGGIHADQVERDVQREAYLRLRGAIGSNGRVAAPPRRPLPASPSALPRPGEENQRPPRVVPGNCRLAALVNRR